jgi:hypothetical protein
MDGGYKMQMLVVTWVGADDSVGIQPSRNLG